MEYKLLTPQYDAALAKLIRSSLKVHRLDIPGTVYFDDVVHSTMNRFYLKSL